MTEQDLPSSEPPADAFLPRVLRWLRAGYPQGVPERDYVALLGILQRSLTIHELDQVVHELTRGDAEVITREQVLDHLQQLLKGTPSAADISGVSARLAAGGWPLASSPRGDEEKADLVRLQSDLARLGLVERVVGWLRGGYPTGLPTEDFVPLFALLRRRLSDEEVVRVGRQLQDDGVLLADRVDMGTAIAIVTHEMPSAQDVERVRSYLDQVGWPVDFRV